MEPVDTGNVIEIKKKRRCKPGTVALREIKYYQQTPRKLIPAAVLKRLVRAELDGHRIRPTALEAIQSALEEFATDLFKGTQMLAIHAKRKTIYVEDMRTLKRAYAVMNGAHDLSPEPVNPRMSEAHKKKKSRTRTNTSSSGLKRERKKKQEPVLMLADLSSTMDVEIECEEEREEMIERVMEQEVGVDDDWLL